MSNYFKVAVNFPKINSVLTYKSELPLQKGQLVEVPLGRRTSHGVIIEKVDKIEFDESKVKAIDTYHDEVYHLDQLELALYEWMHKYYHYPLGKLIFDCLPKSLKRPRKIQFEQGQNLALPFELSTLQESIVSKIKEQNFNGFSQSYLHGVTGSGKSVIYLQLIKKTLDQGMSVQFLLPEINLTPQFTDFFKNYVGCTILTYHSGVSPSEKYLIWKHLKETDGPVLVMGVRSSIFLPIPQLGLIIIDEEHDQSFKQTDRCPYNGRDVAIKKAQLANVPLIMGSATPAMENYYKFSALDSKYFQLKERAGEGQFPKIKLIDLKENKHDEEIWPLTNESIDAIKEALDKKEQVLVFINKLGYSNSLQCRNCGHQFYNEKCGCMNNLRYFKSKNCLSCSYCDFVMPCPEVCPDCGSMTLKTKGFGTEKVSETLSSIFTDYKIGRFDRDFIKSTKDLKSQLTAFDKGEIDVLVGTQMLAKGHNFEKVNLVVVLGIDSILSYSDFRSNEKAFQLLAQVSGRAGRYSSDSKILIQTLNPEHRLFEYVRGENLFEFYPEELPLRELCSCPPYTKIAMLYFSSRFQDRLIPHITKICNALKNVIDKNFSDIECQGPFPQSVEKKANQYTWGILLKSKNLSELHSLLATFEQNYEDASSISFKIDVDPLTIF